MQLLVLLQKEIRQIKRNSFLPKIMLIFPIVVMLVLPTVTTMDVKHVGVGVVDKDCSTISRRIVSHLESSGYFTMYGVGRNYRTMMDALNRGEVDVIVTIPDDYEKDVVRGSAPKLAIDANAVNANKGTIGMQYVLQTLRSVINEINAESGREAVKDPISIQYRYNETLNYKHYMIPALMIMLLVMICGFIPAINLVVEKEKGTIEQINVTPVSRINFTLAKLIPFWVVGLVVVTIAMIIGALVYTLIPQGNIGLIYLASMLFVFTMSGLAITIANFSATMQQTMFVMFFVVINFVLMSGLLTPITSMPMWAQNITYFLPPRYYIEIMRSIYLKGASLIDLQLEYLALSIFAIIFNILAWVTYKKQE